MGVFLPTDCVRWFELIDALLERVTLFKSPASWFRQTDAEADKHVRQMLASIDVMRTIPLPDPRLVTFIG